jgi:hypothetical protein
MASVPKNTNARKAPVKKKKFDLFQYKKKTNIDDIPDKPVEWLVTSKGLQDVTGLLGFPMGYTSLSRGFSNTGKSTSLLEGMVASQKAGRLPIIIDLEHSVGEYRLSNMGFDWNADNVIKVDNTFLFNNFGKKNTKRTPEAAIEDLGACINFFLNEQESGSLPIGIDFFIDSIGVLNCVNTIEALEKDSSTNNMWNAFAYEQSFKGILNHRIPASRKQNYEYSNSLIAVQKIWLDNMGAGVVKHKGGEAFYFGSRLIYHFGGVKSNGAKAVSATSKKKEVNFGIEASVAVPKNHIDGPYGGISMSGKIISTPHGFIRADKDGIEEYKKEKLLYFRKILGEEISVDDIMLKYHDINTIGDEKEMGVDDFNKTMTMNFGDGSDVVDMDTGEVKE